MPNEFRLSSQKHLKWRGEEKVKKVTANRDAICSGMDRNHEVEVTAAPRAWRRMERRCYPHPGLSTLIAQSPKRVPELPKSDTELGDWTVAIQWTSQTGKNVRGKGGFKSRPCSGAHGTVTPQWKQWTFTTLMAPSPRSCQWSARTQGSWEFIHPNLQRRPHSPSLITLKSRHERSCHEDGLALKKKYQLWKYPSWHMGLPIREARWRSGERSCSWFVLWKMTERNFCCLPPSVLDTLGLYFPPHTQWWALCAVASHFIGFPWSSADHSYSLESSSNHVLSFSCLLI